MSPLFKKLNFKNQSKIYCLNSPTSFNDELQAQASFTQIEKSLKSAKNIEFVMIFVTKLKEIEESIAKIDSKLCEDAVLWYCYPKGTSKKYNCEFNRDTGWAVMGQYEFEGVRIVSIDEDWSALRFRKLDKIKSFTRSAEMALTSKGKEKAKK